MIIVHVIGCTFYVFVRLVVSEIRADHLLYFELIDIMIGIVLGTPCSCKTGRNGNQGTPHKNMSYFNLEEVLNQGMIELVHI